MSELVAITCASCGEDRSKHRLAWIRVDQGGNSAALCCWECALRFVRKLRLSEALILDGCDVPPPWREALDAESVEWLRGMIPDPPLPGEGRETKEATT